MLSTYGAQRAPTRLYHAQVTPKQEQGTPASVEAVQEERLRKRVQWTRNVSKVRDMEYKRRHGLSVGTGAALVLDDGREIPDFSQGCTNPIMITLVAGDKWSMKVAECSTEFLVKCGRPDCYECASRRRRMWAARAHTEVLLASRTWFVTITASPETMSRWFCEAGLEYYPNIGNQLTKRQYDRVVKAGYRDIQLWKKRVAKNVPGLRFLFTVEKHTGKRSKSAWGKAGFGDYAGLPHFHGFVHETATPLRYVELKRQSRDLGFHKANLVDLAQEPEKVWYLVKYISKDNGSRNLWASFRYGRPTAAALGLDPTAWSTEKEQTTP